MDKDGLCYPTPSLYVSDITTPAPSPRSTHTRPRKTYSTSWSFRYTGTTTSGDGSLTSSGTSTSSVASSMMPGRGLHQTWRTEHTSSWPLPPPPPLNTIKALNYIVTETPHVNISPYGQWKFCCTL